MNVYKLRYNNESESLDDLIAKGVINEDKSYTSITEAVVYIGNIIDVPATFNEEGEVLTDATFLDGYYVDVMLNEAVDFGDNEVVTNNPKHTFA